MLSFCTGVLRRTASPQTISPMRIRGTFLAGLLVIRNYQPCQLGQTIPHQKQDKQADGDRQTDSVQDVVENVMLCFKHTSREIARLWRVKKKGMRDTNQNLTCALSTEVSRTPSMTFLSPSPAPARVYPAETLKTRQWRPSLMSSVHAQ